MHAHPHTSRQTHPHTVAPMDRHARRGVSSHTHAHPQTHTHTRQAWGVITRYRGGRDWARRLSLTRCRWPPERPRCSAIALAGSRMARSELVHIVGLQVDVSSYRFAAVLGGSPAEAHCMVHRPCATGECSCIALSLADSRLARSEPVHVDGTRVDASRDVPTAGMRGSPVELHAPWTHSARNVGRSIVPPRRSEVCA